MPKYRLRAGRLETSAEVVSPIIAMLSGVVEDGVIVTTHGSPYRLISTGIDARQSAPPQELERRRYTIDLAILGMAGGFPARLSARPLGGGGTGELAGIAAT